MMMTMYLFQSLFPTVGLVTERTLELFSRSSTHIVAAGSLDVPLAHLLLQMLLQTRLVGKLS